MLFIIHSLENDFIVLHDEIVVEHIDDDATMGFTVLSKNAGEEPGIKPPPSILGFPEPLPYQLRHCCPMCVSPCAMLCLVCL